METSLHRTFLSMETRYLMETGLHWPFLAMETGLHQPYFTMETGLHWTFLAMETTFFFFPYRNI